MIWENGSAGVETLEEALTLRLICSDDRELIIGLHRRLGLIAWLAWLAALLASLEGTPITARPPDFIGS